ncbi:sensor histidine kinase [Corynebacterium freneyi]|uniref:sensor histidine kinase n=1 Tax=Corynebacterium freneyi TaxID=134034 RepID=UPI00068E7F82|nr:sensor histidine kinase [Corynebacterium freneyi]
MSVSDHADRAEHADRDTRISRAVRAARSATGAAAGPGRPWSGVLFDAVLAALVLALCAGLDHSSVYDPPVLVPGQDAAPEWAVGVHWAWVIVAWGVIAVRRVWPDVANIALPTLLAFHLAVLPTGYASFVVTCFAMYHLGRHVPRRWFVPVWIAVSAGVLVALVVKGGYLVIAPEVGLVMTPVALTVLGFFWMLGLNGRRRDRELMALRDRAELAAIAERTRIAREMHDIVAHSLTAVIAQADGGRFIAAKNPDKAVEALENIASTARDSLGQMRQLLSVLRDPADFGDGSLLDDGPPQAPSGPSPAGAGESGAGKSGTGETGTGSDGAGRSVAGSATEYAPMPGLDALPQLIAESTRAGLRVTFTEEGTRPAVGATMQLTIYRIVQESLTNALKHAGRVAVDVRLEWGKRDCTVTVRNDAGTGNVEVEPSRGSRGEPRIGRGITGMRERVALHGGTLEIDDAPGEFTVVARLPKG